MRIEFSEEAEADFSALFDHLFESYIAFGEPQRDAFDRAALRTMEIRRSADSLSKAPNLGTRRDDILPGLRNVTIGSAVFYFRIDAAEDRILILAVFFGGQDHFRRMLARLL